MQGVVLGIIQMPAAALPGTNRVTGVALVTGDSAQVPFQAREFCALFPSGG